MTYPTVHLNGTGAATLLDDCCAAANALRTAMEKLAAAGPNGRDYYPQGPQAFYQAQDEHYNRLERLRSVLKELEDVAEHVAAQGVRR